MTTAYYFEELPMEMINAAIKVIESKVVKAELELAVECATQCVAYATLEMKNGGKLYVARKRHYSKENQDYWYVTQLLDEDLNVLCSESYEQHWNNKAETYDYFQLDSTTPIVPFFSIAVKAIRVGKYGRL